MSDQQSQVDALPGTWWPQNRGSWQAWECTLDASDVRLCHMWRASVTGGHESYWYGEVLCGALDQTDDETVQAGGPTAAAALRALAVEVRRVADAHAADAAALESLMSVDVEGDAREVGR